MVTCCLALFLSLLDPASAADSEKAVSVVLQIERAADVAPAADPIVNVDAQVVKPDGFGPPLSFRCPVAGDCRIELPEGTWIFSSGDPRYYIVPRSERVSTGARQPIALRLFATSRLVGRIEEPKDAKALTLRFRGVGERAVEDQVQCPIEDGRFRCTLPAGTWDLRLRVPGHASDYRWDFRLTPHAESDMGVLRRRGASVTGRIDLASDARIGNDGITVVLMPDAPAHTRDERRRRALRTKANTRGHFLFDGVEPGEYVISASGSGLASEAHPIVVVASREAELRRPLVLTTPRRIAVTVVPPFDDGGKRWRVSLWKAGGEGPSIVVTESLVDHAGAWSFERAWPARYELAIGDGRGNRWISRELEVTADVDLVVPIQTIALRGELLFGDKPIGGSVTFSGLSGARIAMTAAEDGTFKGRITSARDEEWHVRVENPELGVMRNLRKITLDYGPDGDAHVRIALPAGRFEGKVVHEDGSPADGAIVDVTSRDGAETLTQLFAGHDGRFGGAALPSGTYDLVAKGHTGTGPAESDVVSVTVDGDGTDELALVLRRSRYVRGVVVSGGGPVVGARLRVVPADRAFITLASATTDASGRFTTLLPPGTQRADFFVTARGFATRLFERALDDKELVIRLAQSGGELVIDVPAYNQDDPLSLHPWIFHDGAVIHAHAFARDLRIDGKRFTITAGLVDPGTYTLCLARSAELPRPRPGAAVPAGKCTTALVPPYGRATLAIGDTEEKR